MDELITGVVFGALGATLTCLLFLEPKEIIIVDPQQKVYIEKLEHELQKEQTKNEIYKIMLECKN